MHNTCQVNINVYNADIISLGLLESDCFKTQWTVLIFSEPLWPLVQIPINKCVIGF